MSSPIRREDLGDLQAFLLVAEQRSFTRAAAMLGVSRSALSHTVRRLEQRLKIRLLGRTTRSVSLTDAGERLFLTTGPRFSGLQADLEALSALREKPAGTVRITTDEHAAKAYLWPALRRVLPDYPDITVELEVDYGLTDIVAERFDAGVRPGGIITPGMIAVPVGPDMRMVAVAAPAYLASRPPPQTPHDLTGHACINLRLPTHGGIYAWEFYQDGREFRVRVEGQLVFNSISLILDAVRDGYGIAFMAEGVVRADLDEGRLVQVLADWSEPFAGYHLYYPSRRQHSPAFAVIIDALRYRG